METNILKVVDPHFLETESILINAGADVNFIFNKNQNANILQLMIKNVEFKDLITLDFIKLCVERG